LISSNRGLSPLFAFFAYRALEDIAYRFGVVGGDKPDWDAMNQALGTSKQHWRCACRPNVNARIGHGERQDRDGEHVDRRS